MVAAVGAASTAGAGLPGPLLGSWAAGFFLLNWDTALYVSNQSADRAIVSQLLTFAATKAPPLAKKFIFSEWLCKVSFLLHGACWLHMIL